MIYQQPARGDYFSPLVDAVTNGAIHRGTLTIATMYHDDDCRRPDGGPCTCVPDIELVDDPDPRREAA